METNSSMNIESYVSNGSVWTKGELLMYLASVIHAMQDIAAADKEIENRQLLIRAKEIEARRTEFNAEVMEKPSGLSALSLSKNRRYQKWLEEAPRREAALNRKREEENLRVVAVEQRLAELQTEQNGDLDKKRQAEEQLDFLLSQNILPEEYSAPGPLLSITGYLVKNRAHTLTDAINLYHQESHWRQMENMMEDQGRAARRHQKYMEEEQQAQQRFLQNMAAHQAHEMQELHRKIDEARSDIDDAKFFAEMAYIKSLFD